MAKGKSGLDRILAPEGNEDEFAKGIVGKPSETESVRNDGNQTGLGEETLLYGGGHFRSEKVGLEDGVSIRKDLDQSLSEPEYSYQIDPLTGSAPERKVGRVNNQTVQGKNSNHFLIGEM